MRIRISVGVLAVLVALVACTKDETATPSAGKTAAENAVMEITEEFIREIIAEISSDAYEGRGQENYYHPLSKGLIQVSHSCCQQSIL